MWFFLHIFQLLAKTSTVNELAIGKEANACNGALATLVRLAVVEFLSSNAARENREDQDPVKQRKHQNLLLHEDGQNLNQIKVP